LKTETVARGCWSILSRRGVSDIAVYAPNRITRPSSEPYSTTQHPEEEDKALISKSKERLNTLTKASRG